MKKTHFTTLNPATNTTIDQTFPLATEEEINSLIQEAEKTFENYREVSQKHRSRFLLEIVNQLESAKEEIIDIGHQETALPIGRLEGEMKRTQNQIRLFSTLLEEGSWVNAIIDLALPERNPIPRLDHRQMQIPLGPVVVFGASNFPLAFSVAGGDTVSALAAGCPVIVKSHPEHPGTSQLVAEAIQRAAQKQDVSKNVFQLVHGASHKVGELLVQHPSVKAVGFTGSFYGGKALFDLANQRETPIPVFAEMGSVNPVIILPHVLKEKPEEIAAGLAQSVVLGVGQFCTNPGLVFVPNSEGKDLFLQALKVVFEKTEAATMLSPTIASRYHDTISTYLKSESAELLAKGKKQNRFNEGCPHFFKTDFLTFKKHKLLSEEVFGPSSIVIETEVKDLEEIAKSIDGQLTATIHGTETDFESQVDLIKSLTQKVGRMILNGFPTGVEVCHAMVHGGPYPSTTQQHTTSVGTEAIRRFTRPICYQNFVESLLPEELKNNNPLSIQRKLNGIFSKDRIK
ncbi:MAG: aldehyde dehydrogenase (NADP(+)) [Flavobacteriaceae bacterium]